MTGRRTIEDSLRWLAAGTTLFLAAVDGFDDSAIRAPSRLPGWSRAHVLAHVGFNAVALMNLVNWARTGVPTPMYASAEQRELDIQRGATWSAPELCAFVASTATDLAGGVASLDDRTWTADVVTALGRTVAAAEVPWLRAREVVVHAVDLRVGVAFGDVPDDLVSALMFDVVNRRTSLRRDPAISLEADEGDSWQIGTAAPELTVIGARAELTAWIIGRSEGTALRSSNGDMPQLSPWL